MFNSLHQYQILGRLLSCYIVHKGQIRHGHKCCLDMQLMGPSNFYTVHFMQSFREAQDACKGIRSATASKSGCGLTVHK